MERVSERTGLTEQYLKRIALGERKHTRSALLLLANDLLVTPLAKRSDERSGAEKLSVVTLAQGEKKLIPTFTSEDYFLSWSQGKHQSFSVAGADLAISIPRGSSLLIDPGQAHSIELSPEQVNELSQVNEIPDPAKLSPLELPPQPAASSAPADPLLADLSILLEGYPEVGRSYFLATPGEEAEGILRLVTEGLSAERRFLLMADIAEISRMYFGIAGAIDVYDDLDMSSLGNQPAFEKLPPFYTRRSDERAKDSRLSQTVDKVVNPNGDVGSNGKLAGSISYDAERNPPSRGGTVRDFLRGK